jgi:NhaA family Na+:H+ antiporter
MNRRLTSPVPVLPLTRQLFAPILRFLAIEAGSGVLLIGAAALALAWANSPWAASYTRLWHAHVGAGLPLLQHDVLFWVNDGLMTLFFLVVGLEIRRELEEGSLADPRIASLPIAAALAGVAAPAVLYLLLVGGDPVARHGWAVATATDIAFAAAILSLLGNSVPRALRMLLLTLAISDDIAGILIIAIVYSSGIRLLGLLIAAGGVLAVLLLQRLGTRSMAAYALPALFVWYGMLEAGVQPAISGAILGLMTPVVQIHPDGNTAPCSRLETALHPWVAYLIMPVFALANAGVSVDSQSLAGDQPWRIALGIVGGLVLGKPLGIILATILAVRWRLSALPDEIRPRHILLLGCLGGVGFTISIFIATLAFTSDPLLKASKLAVLAASAVSATIGLAVGRLTRQART